jgi:hypothetical protein
MVDSIRPTSFLPIEGVNFFEAKKEEITREIENEDIEKILNQLSRFLITFSAKEKRLRLELKHADQEQQRACMNRQLEIYDKIRPAITGTIEAIATGVAACGVPELGIARHFLLKAVGESVNRGFQAVDGIQDKREKGELDALQFSKDMSYKTVDYYKQSMDENNQHFDQGLNTMDKVARTYEELLKALAR